RCSDAFTNAGLWPISPYDYRSLDFKRPTLDIATQSLGNSILPNDFLEPSIPDGLSAHALRFGPEKVFHLHCVSRHDIVLRMVKQSVVGFQQNLLVPVSHFEYSFGRAHLLNAVQNSNLLQRFQTIGLEGYSSRSRIEPFPTI